MIESLDAAVGRVLDALTQFGLAERTVVVFTSDNGGLITQGTTSNAPLRYGKASAYEGGVRVPLIVHWPGTTAPGSACDTPVVTMDLFPTLLEIAGLPQPMQPDSAGAEAAPVTLDGVSLVPLLRGTGTLSRDDLFWHYPHHQHYQLGGTMPYGAIRSGDFKLIEFYNDMRVELYDLRTDVGEQHDLAAERPAQADELRSRLQAWRASVGAQMPIPNPQHDPNRPEYNPPEKGAT
jgi:arylsulfatase A-like enzyme